MSMKFDLAYSALRSWKSQQKWENPNKKWEIPNKNEKNPENKIKP